MMRSSHWGTTPMRELIAFMPGYLHLDTVLMGMGTAVADLEGVPRVPWNPLSSISLYQARLETQGRNACMFVIVSATYLPQ